MKRGGEGGVDVEQRGGDIEPQIPTGPTVPDFILRRRAQALQTVREATQEEIACVASYPARKTIISVQCGRVPRSPGEWLGVMTAASFLDRPLTEQGREARDNRDHLIGEIRKTHQAYQAMRETPPAPPSPVSTGLDDEEDEYEERLSLERNWKPWAPPAPDPKVTEQHERHCQIYAWICSRLGYCEPPIVELESVILQDPTPVRPARDRFTLMSCRKARERAAERGHRIDPRWAGHLSVMYAEVVAEIGTCPPDVNEDGVRVFTLDRIENARGYVPGNIRWLDKSGQRDNQQRNGQTRVSG